MRTLGIVSVGCIMLVLSMSTSRGGLTHYWPFDADYSDSVGSADGSALGGGVSITTAAGEYIRGSGGLRIAHDTAGGDYVDINQAVVATSQNAAFTISAWYRYEDIGSQSTDSRNFVWETTPSYQTGFGIGTADDAEWFFDGTPGNVSDNSGPNVVDGLWHHVVIVWNKPGNAVHYYHDGVLRDSPAIGANDLVLGADGLHIGNHRAGDGGRNWDGYIDEFAIWDHALTAGDVRNLYRGASPQDLSNLKPLRDALKVNMLAYYDFDETGTTGLANKAPGATGGNATWTASPPDGSTGFAGDAAFNPGDGLSDRGTLLVGNALNLVDADGGNTVRVAVPYGTPELGSVFTISAWTYLAPGAANASARFQAFESKDVGVWDVSWGTVGNYSTTGRDDYRIYVETSYADISSFAEEEWDHVALVYDTTGNPTVSAYVNGDPTPVTATDTSGSFVFSALHLGGSRDSASGDRDWDGMIDEVALWTRALPYNEIAALHAFGRTGYPLYHNQGTLFVIR